MNMVNSIDQYSKRTVCLVGTGMNLKGSVMGCWLEYLRVLRHLFNMVTVYNMPFDQSPLAWMVT